MSVDYVTDQGIKFTPAYNSEQSLRFAPREFQVQDDDVFNVTYPKSGTVWMTEILSLIRSGGDPAWNQTSLNSTHMPWFTTCLGLKAALNYPSPHLLTCHLPIQLFPTSFFSSRAKVNQAGSALGAGYGAGLGPTPRVIQELLVIYTLRNPKDVLFS